MIPYYLSLFQRIYADKRKPKKSEIVKLFTTIYKGIIEHVRVEEEEKRVTRERVDDINCIEK